MIQLETGGQYLTNDGRIATCLGITADGTRAAIEINGRKMIETYGIDGTFRVTSDRKEDEGLHIAGKYLPPLTVFAVVNDEGKIFAISFDPTKISDADLAKGRLIELNEVRK